MELQAASDRSEGVRSLHPFHQGGDGCGAGAGVRGEPGAAAGGGGGQGLCCAPGGGSEGRHGPR